MRIVYTMTVLLFLVSCAGEDRASMLGISRNKPDEFAVLKRDTLTVPTNDALPAPDSLPKQNAQSQDRGASIVTGTKTEPATQRSVAILGQGEQAFLDKATGMTAIDPDIRSLIKTEAHKGDNILTDTLNLPAADKVITPKAESERLKALKEEQKPISDGDVAARYEKNPLLPNFLP